MGNIKTFETPGLERPLEEALNTTAGNARRVGAFYNQGAGALEQLGSDQAAALRSVGKGLGSGVTSLGDAYVNYLDHKEISAGAAKGTELMSKLSDVWNKTISDPKIDPNDPNIKAKFMQDTLEPALQQFKDDSGYFSTEKSRDFAESFIERFRQHMDTKTNADMSTLAGIALKTNVQTTVNSLSSMVASDPSSLDFALKSADHAIGAKVSSSPNLDAATAASVRSEVGLKAKQDIVKSAVIGMIQKNPGIDLDAIQKKYGEYINGAEMKIFQKTAQAQQKADLIQQKQIETFQRQQEEHAAKTATSKVIADNFSADENGNITIKPGAVKQALDIAKQYPQAGASAAEATIKFIQSQQDKERKVVDNPAVVTDLSNRLFDPNKPLTEIDLMRASTDGKISNQTYTKLKGMLHDLEQTPLKGPVYQETMKAVHGALVLNVPGIPGKDDKGQQNYALFVQNFIPQYLAKYRDGTLPPNALDTKDPNSMISQAMAPFRRTSAQRMQDYVSSIGGIGADKAPKVDGAEVPAALRGIAALQYNPEKKLWRDQATGTVYDSAGHEVKP